MVHETIIQHVGIECRDQHSADRFFTEVLRIPKVKSTVLSKELSERIFNIPQETVFETYDNGKMRFEVFITAEKRQSTFNHIGVQVENTKDFITRCTQQGLDPFVVEKQGRRLLFVRDFSGNLFEVLEK